MSLPESPSGAIRAMKKTTVTEPAGHPVEVVDDPLTEVLRSGAQRLLVQGIEAEAEAFLALMADWKLEDGRARFVRHGGPDLRRDAAAGGVVLGRLKGKWEDEYTAWRKRDLSGRRFVYIWADGVYLQARMESQAECPRREYPPSLCERMIGSADHGDHWSDAGRQEGVSRFSGGLPRKRAKLEGASGRPQAQLEHRILKKHFFSECCTRGAVC